MLQSSHISLKMLHIILERDLSLEMKINENYKQYHDIFRTNIIIKLILLKLAFIPCTQIIKNRLCNNSIRRKFKEFHMLPCCGL